MGKKTPLYEKHLELGGRIVDFAGWDLPVQYSSVIDEHMAVRNNAGLFDISHMGEFTLKGKGSGKLLSKLIPSSLSKLEDNKGMYSCFCNPGGGVIDDLFIFRVTEDSYYLVVNGGTREKDFAWIEKNLKNFSGGEIVLEDVSDSTAKIDIQGPASVSIMEKVFPGCSISSIERFYFKYLDFKSHKVMVSNTGYTGELGFELYIDSQYAASLWDDLLGKGKDDKLVPCGLASRDSLRLEACYSLYGHELSDTINPIEAALSWLVNSEEDYIGADILRKEKAEGSQRKIICLEVTGKGIPRDGYKVFYNGDNIGYVTSGGYSPFLKKGIAFALVKSGVVKIGNKVEVIIRDKGVEATFIKRPFYNYNG